mgnify:CR=1 FL=1
MIHFILWQFFVLKWWKSCKHTKPLHYEYVEWYVQFTADFFSQICELCPNPGGIFKETDAGKYEYLKYGSLKW